MDAPIIEVKDLTFTYLGAEKPAIKSINLTVNRGEFIVLTGPSGCGKTTLCRALIGLIPHFYSGDLRGDIRVLGMNVRETEISQLAKHVGLVFQNPDTQIVMTTVRREVAFGLENMSIQPNEIRKRVREALLLLDILHLADENVSRLSGGQKQRVAIASVLAMKPDILILDEPTAYLSPSSAKKLIESLYELNRRLGITILLIEHRLDLATRYASRLIIMDNGEIVADGDPRTIFEKKLKEIKCTNVPSLVKLFHRLKAYGLRFKSIPLTVKEASSCLKEVLEVD